MQPKAKMKSMGSTSPVRQRGQRSLLTSSLFSKSNCAPRAEGAKINPTKQTVSLSAFLDRKVGKTPSCSIGSIREKRSSFSSFGFGSGGNAIGRSDDGRSGSGTLDGSVFRQLNPVAKDGIRVPAAVNDEFDGLRTDDDGQESKKRSNPFGQCRGEDDRPAAKLLVVLGDDPKPKQKRMMMRYEDRKPKFLFNHYANGSGLWDCDREGIDSEEVGCTEPWEGMGSTTLGGLEWH